MKRRKVIGGATATELPDDIIFEILTRVSCATSLWEFRCVCKSWCSMISSPNFKQAHLNNSLITSNFVILPNNFHEPTTKILPLRTFLYVDGLADYYSSDITHKDAIEVDCPVFKFYYDPQLPMDLISTCNGLCLMLVNKRDFYLWNPFTKQARKLPDFFDHADLLEYPDDDLRFGAFGFDDRSHDYNVVAFIENVRQKKNTTKFYSLKTDSWTRLDDFKCTAMHYEGQFLNGEVHWLTFCLSPYSLKMVSLDLSSQVHRAVDLPNNLSISFNRLLSIGGVPKISVHGGCLYVLCIFRCTMDVWVREDNGVPDSSWVMVATIPWYGEGSPKTEILCVTEDGGFLLAGEPHDIIIYHPKSNSFTHPYFRNSFPHADICIQSLVSPFPDGMVKKKSQTRCNASEPLTRMKGSGRDTQELANAVSATVESQNCSEMRTNSQMGLPTRRSPGSSLRRSPRLQHPVPSPPSSSSLRRSTRFHHLPPSQSLAEQDCPGSRF